MQPLSQQDKIILAAQGRNSLMAYARAQYPWYLPARHLRILIEHLEALERGEFKQLMVFCPPQHAKTTTCSELFPAWYLGRHPSHRTIVASYGQDRAEDFGERIRYLLSTPYHQGIFPDCRLSGDTKAKDDFALEPVPGMPMGACRAAGRGASITGLPAELIVIDDPEKDEAEARSEAVQRELRIWLNGTIFARMHPGTRLMMIKTRWDPDDIAGWELAEHGEDWKVLSLPALGYWTDDVVPEDVPKLPEGAQPWSQYSHSIRFPDEDGQSLWPERYPKEFMMKRRDRSRRDQWLALYQQTPTRDGDDIVFAEAWFKTISKSLVPDQIVREMNLYLLVDPANAKHKKADFTNMWVVGLTVDRNIIVLDGVRDKLDQKERCDAGFELHRTWNPVSRVRCVGWEQYSLQTDIDYVRARQKSANYTFRIEKVGGNVPKGDRIRGLVGMFRDEQIKFVDTIPGTTLGVSRNLTEDFKVLEFLRYPAVRHDDMLDCLARIRDMISEGLAFFPVKKKQSTEAFYRARHNRRKGISWMGR